MCSIIEYNSVNDKLYIGFRVSTNGKPFSQSIHCTHHHCRFQRWRTNENYSTEAFTNHHDAVYEVCDGDSRYASVRNRRATCRGLIGVSVRFGGRCDLSRNGVPNSSATRSHASGSHLRNVSLKHSVRSGAAYPVAFAPYHLVALMYHVTM